MLTIKNEGADARVTETISSILRSEVQQQPGYQVVERAAVGGLVDAVREAAHHGVPHGGQVTAQLRCLLRAVAGGGAGSRLEMITISSCPTSPFLTASATARWLGS